MKHIYKVWDEFNSDKVMFVLEERDGSVYLRIPLVDPDDWIILTKNEAQDLIGALKAVCQDIMASSLPPYLGGERNET